MHHKPLNKYFQMDGPDARETLHYRCRCAWRACACTRICFWLTYPIEISLQLFSSSRVQGEASFHKDAGLQIAPCFVQSILEMVKDFGIIFDSFPTSDSKFVLFNLLL